MYLGYDIMKKNKSLYYLQCKDDIFALGVILYQMIYGKVTNYISKKNAQNIASYSLNTYLKKKM